MPRDLRPLFSRIGWWRAVTPPVSADRIEAITGLEKLKLLPGVDHVIVNRGAGEAVDWRQGYRDFVVQVYGSGGDYEEVEAQCASVDTAVSVTYGDAVSSHHSVPMIAVRPDAPRSNSVPTHLTPRSGGRLLRPGCHRVVPDPIRREYIDLGPGNRAASAIEASRKGKPLVRGGRKATGLSELAGPPK